VARADILESDGSDKIQRWFNRGLHRPKNPCLNLACGRPPKPSRCSYTGEAQEEPFSAQYAREEARRFLEHVLRACLGLS
jgi:hypothetical protein